MPVADDVRAAILRQEIEHTTEALAFLNELEAVTGAMWADRVRALPPTDDWRAALRRRCNECLIANVAFSHAYARDRENALQSVADMAALRALLHDRIANAQALL